MNSNQRKRRLNRGLSIALALLLVATVCVTVAAFVSGSRKKGENNGSTAYPSAQSTTLASTPASTSSSKPETPVSVIPSVFVCPVSGGYLAKSYSADIPVFSLTMEDYRIHAGVDITADAGTPVFACADGTVESVAFDPMMGQTVVISHAGGYRSVYRNLTTAMPAGITEGLAVSAGDTIGYVGDTALVEISDSPHLHFEILDDESPVNPLTHISVSVKSDGTDYEDKSE